MSQHIARVDFIMNGIKWPGIVSIEDTEVDHGVRVPTLDGDGYAEVNGSYGINIEYAPPLKGKRIPFLETKTTPATAIAYYVGGGKRTYRGIQVLKESASKADGKTAKTETWECMIEGRKDA